MDRQQTLIDAPLEVHAVGDGITISGPDGLEASLTPEAAVASARRLLNAAGGAAEEPTYQKPLG